MDLSLLELIRCPANCGGRSCHAELHLDRGVARPVFFAGSKGEDLAEGVLRCGACDSCYPVICGVPVLLQAVDDWIRGNYYFLLGFSGEMGAPPTSIRSFLRESASRSGQLPPPQIYDRRWSTRVAKFVSSYLISHFLGLEKLELLSPAQRRLAMEMAGSGGPHEVLQVMLDDLEPPGEGRDGPVLDVGCSVGGMTARLAAGGRLAVGVDISFESLVWARALLRGRPGPLNRGPVFTEGDNRIDHPLHPPEGRRCEFVLAGGEALPFADGSFRVTASCNLIDVMDKPPGLLDEKRRLLVPGGALLLSTPFLHTTRGVSRCFAPEGRQPADILHSLLDERGFEVAAVEEDVPWVLYHYRRRLDFYQTFCLSARRGCAAGGK